MKTAALALSLMLAAPVAWAQEAAEAEGPQTARAEQGAVIRALDKVSGQTTDFELAPGQSGRMGRLTITLGECRYPADDPASNAFAWLTILDDVASEPAFQGWMIAAAPALNALDHPRYDVWVIRCNIPEG